MPRFVANRFVELCGIATSILTAILIIAIEQWFDFSLFTLTFWVVIPAGAFITGIAAASGYYLGALLVDRRPTKMLLVNMVAIAAGTFFLIYYLQYRTMEIDGVPVSNSVAFTTFLQIVLTKAEYGLMRSGSEGVEVGTFGYVIGFIQFLAFALGGLAMYKILANKAFCEHCERYYKQVAKHEKTFATEVEFLPYSMRLRSLSPPSSEYLHILKEPHQVKKTKPGAMSVQWFLLRCQSCGAQILNETPRVLNQKSEWREVDELKRSFAVNAASPLTMEIEAAGRAANFMAQ